MNFLVVLKDTLIERSTFLYVQLQENKTLLHFSPEFHLEGLTLGEIYQAEGLSAVLHFFKVELELPVKDYIELSLESWDRAVVELFPEGLMIDTNDGKIHLTAAVEKISRSASHVYSISSIDYDDPSFYTYATATI